uniref:Uncharacterized protein n=1 Tax=Rhodnius prolixus TaxID=13249 RepID=T1HY79_RHOPR
MSLKTLLQSVKLLMLRYMATPPALRLDDDDTATDDVVAICLFLPVLQYDLRSKPDTFTASQITFFAVILPPKTCISGGKLILKTVHK